LKSLEVKKIEVEILQVEAAKASLELRIAERLDEIDRIKETIAVSDAKIIELKDKLKGRVNG
jgi:hypothetical protein